MGRTPFLLLLHLSFLLLLTSTAAQYIVTNNASTTIGGIRFESEAGTEWTIDLMHTINSFIWKVFNQNCTADRKNVPILNVYITILNDGALGETGGDNIYLDANGIGSFPPGSMRFEFASVMYHEMTHIFQWSGQGTAPGGLTEGVADYIRIKSNYYHPEAYTKPGEGSRWDEGYGITARFLEYCDSLRDGFTPALNNMMRYVYMDEYFELLLGKPLDQVWNEYKAMYGNITASRSDSDGRPAERELEYDRKFTRY